MNDGALVVAAERANVQIGLKLAEVLPTRFTTLRVNAEVCRLALNLPGDEKEHIGGWCFFDAKCAAWKPQIGKVHSKPEPIGGSPTPADQRHVLGREHIVPHDQPRVGRRIEQRRTR